MGVKATAHSGKYRNIIGKFTPNHPEKYRGSYPLVYKSKLEARMMLYLDSNQNVKSWVYEPASIQYIDKSDRNRKKNYWIDFMVEMVVNGTLKRLWIEVKPSCETHKPTGNKYTSTLLESTKTYIKNLCKWTAAKQLAKHRGAEFMIVTEDFFKKK